MSDYIQLTGRPKLSEEKLAEMGRRAQEIFYHGGMMCLEAVDLFGYTLRLLHAPDLEQDFEITADYNYFEELRHPVAEYGEDKYRLLWCGNIGRRQFANVVIAAFQQEKELVDDPDIIQIDELALARSRAVEWLRYLFPGPTPDETALPTEEFLNTSPEDMLYYWREGGDVHISPETQAWLDELGQRYRGHMADSCFLELGGPEFLHDFCLHLALIDDYYGDIYLFRETFYDFLDHFDEKRYQVMYQMLVEMAQRNQAFSPSLRSEEMDTYPVDMVRNPGRMEVKRYIALLANRELREKVFPAEEEVDWTEYWEGEEFLNIDEWLAGK